MDTLKVVIAPAAKREIKKLQRSVQELVVRVIEGLLTDPRPRGVEKLQGHPKFFRISAGKNHRIIYHIMQTRLIVILLVRDRKNAYRSLGDLDGKLGAALSELESEARANAGLSG